MTEIPIITKTITVEEFIQAIEKNGLPQAREAFFRDERGLETENRNEAKSACAVGMAAINLDIDLATLRDAIDNSVRVNAAPPNEVPFELSLRAHIEGLNDDEELDFKEIANRVREDFPYILDKVITIKY